MAHSVQPQIGSDIQQVGMLKVHSSGQGVVWCCGLVLPAARPCTFRRSNSISLIHEHTTLQLFAITFTSRENTVCLRAGSGHGQGVCFQHYRHLYHHSWIRNYSWICDFYTHSQLRSTCSS
jgi:hypothetical protein